MSKVVYFTARQKVLEVLAAAANIPYTVVDLSTYVPVGTLAIIAMTELEAGGVPAPGDYAISTKRKDAAQGVCSSDITPNTINPPVLESDNCIIPLDALRQFEYDLNGIFAALTVNVRVYVIGYIV
jgi:hypothetical protein